MLYVTSVQYSGASIGVQVSSMALEEAMVAVKLVGAADGIAMQDVAECVVSLASVEGADAPTESTVSTA